MWTRHGSPQAATSEAVKPVMTHGHGVAVHPRVDVLAAHEASWVLDLFLPVKFETILTEIEPVRQAGVVSHANCPVVVDGAVGQESCQVVSTSCAFLPLSLVTLVMMVGALGVPPVVTVTVLARVAEQHVAALVVTDQLVATLCPRKRSTPGATQTALGYRLVVVFWRATEELVRSPVVSLTSP